MPDPIRVLREELYEQVWTVPMVTLAAKYGLSDVALAKTCRRLRIPLPGRGYWARKAAGHHVRRPALGQLPPNALASEREVTFNSSRIERRQRLLEGSLAALAALEADSANRIVVTESGRSRDPILGNTIRSLKTASPDKYGLLATRGDDTFDIAVSSKCLGRALAIMGAVVDAFKRRNWRLHKSQSAAGHIEVAVLGVNLAFRLRERVARLPATRPAPVRGGRVQSYIPSWSPPTYEPSGHLGLSIENCWGLGTRRSWKDGRSQRLEECLNEFMLGLAICAEDNLARQRQRAEQQRQWEAAQLKRYEQERRRTEELARIHSLEAHAAAWTKSKEIVAFLDAVRGEPPTEETAGEREQWLAWATGYAANLNPLLRSASAVWRSSSEAASTT